MVSGSKQDSRLGATDTIIVRVSAKEITALILDEERLRAERNDRKTWKSRVTGIEEYGFGSNDDDRPRRPKERPQRTQRADEEDAEYKLAIEASKHQEEEDRKKRESRAGTEPEDADLAKALKLSKEEEELRRKELEENNATALFDDDLIQTNTQPQPTGFNQGYQQQGAVDWYGNPIDQNTVIPQPTGFLNNAYTNPTGYQSQPTGFQNGLPNGYGAQPTGFDPYGTQQQQQPGQFMTPAAGFNPYAAQPQNTFGQNNFGQNNFGQPQPASQQTPEPIIPTSTNNPWATSNNTQSSVKPLQTGSNNPFASSITSNSRPFPTSTQSQPTLSTLPEQKTMSQFNNTSSFNPPTSFNSTPQKTQTHYEAKLSALLETGEGMDTFGNTGNLRIPAQHTAPGTFVNSAGAGLGRIHDQQTGNNPFLNSQFTGMPQTTYGGQSGGFSGHQVPAATGPAGMGSGFGGGFGGQGSSNPFGSRPNQQQNGQGDLIQF
jgi:epsin